MVKSISGPTPNENRKVGGIQSARGRQQETKNINPQALLLTIQQNFDRGAKHEFFKAFDQMVPAEMKKKDFSYKKLEFYLQIYFVVYIKHPNTNLLNYQ